jgi:hypothetical protein
MYHQIYSGSAFKSDQVSKSKLKVSFPGRSDRVIETSLNMVIIHCPEVTPDPSKEEGQKEYGWSTRTSSALRSPGHHSGEINLRKQPTNNLLLVRSSDRSDQSGRVRDPIR